MTRAALINEIGAAAAAGSVDDTSPAPDEVVVELEAAALNPVDLAIANGTFYAGHPPTPYVPGIEAVGIVRGGSLDGKRVYASGAGRGLGNDGLSRERFTIPESVLIELPDGADPAVACALGTAGLAGWVPLSWRTPVNEGETVLVLGATGTVGRIALQAARHLGAGRVVGAGRDPARLEAIAGLADAVVSVEGDDLGSAIAAACGEGGPSLIYDLLWGTPAVAALSAAPNGSRLVQVGASAGAVAEVPSAFIRGKQTEVVGYTNFGVPRDVIVESYLQMVQLAIDGDLTVAVERISLDDAGHAWAGLVRGDGKYVLVP